MLQNLQILINSRLFSEAAVSKNDNLDCRDVQSGTILVLDLVACILRASRIEPLEGSRWDIAPDQVIKAEAR